MPIVRPKVSVPSPPQRREVRTSSGTHLIQRERPSGAAPAGFSEQEAPTGKLGGTQLRNLVARSANPELTARVTAATTPFAMPVPAAAIPPRPEPSAAIAPAQVIVLSPPPPPPTACDGPEIEILGEVDAIAPFPLVVPTPARSAPPRRRPERDAARIEFARNVLGHGYLARRLFALALLAGFVVSAAWTLTGGP